jgi:hypothetical protein
MYNLDNKIYLKLIIKILLFLVIISFHKSKSLKFHVFIFITKINTWNFKDFDL